MALALRLFLLILLAVALPARAAQAAPLQVRGADEHARKAYPAAWLHADFQPLKPPAGVSAGKTFQAPFRVAAHKPSSHRRGMDREAVLKAEFPRGSSGSLAASAAGREAMPGTVTGDEHARKASPAAWLHADFQPLKPPAGVSAGKTFQAPFRVAAHKPSSHRRGPPRGKNKPTGDKMDREAVLKAEFPGGSSGSLAASAAGREAMPGTVTGAWDHDLHHLERLANHGLRVLELGEAKRDDEDHLASQPISITEPLGDAEGVSAGRTFPGPLVDVAHKPGSHRRGPLRRKNKPTGERKSLEASKHLEQILSDVERCGDAASTSTHADKTWKSMRRVFCWGTPCLVKLMATVLGAALCLIICSVGIWYCWKRKWCFCPSSEDKPNNSSKENLTRVPSSSLLSPSALPQLQHPLEPFPKLTPPQRDPSPLSPLVLFPSYD
ncbi:uncharacterized protein LOC128814116 [Vidua macroura]|uniref:uncharacterized protein LOC128814116 n=1 Tax=Vidua macroura TaxID=187451 RepID=UPI0023A856BE|nr:uncharacterized protein LOC128814116 [Vidua macroura]